MHAQTDPAQAAPFEQPVRPSFTLPVRVYYEDTDAGGVVYYANYLKFCERARTDWLRSCGIGQHRLASEDGVLFVVRSVRADYRQPAVLDDDLAVVSTLAKLGHASLTFHQKVLRDGVELFDAEVVIACIDRHARRAIPIPPAVRAQFATLV